MRAVVKPSVRLTKKMAFTHTTEISGTKPDAGSAGSAAAVDDVPLASTAFTKRMRRVADICV